MKILKLIIICFTINTTFLYADDFADAQIAYSQKEYTKAAKYYQKACKQKNAKACLKLADLYDIGLGIAMDESKALYYFKEACKLGDEDGCNQVEERDPTNQVGC